MPNKYRIWRDTSSTDWSSADCTSVEWPVVQTAFTINLQLVEGLVQVTELSNIIRYLTSTNQRRFVTTLQ